MLENNLPSEPQQQPKRLPENILEILEDHEKLYSSYEFREVVHLVKDLLPQWTKQIENLYKKHFDRYLRIRLQLISQETEDYSPKTVREFLVQAFQDTELLVGAEYESVGEMIDMIAEKPLLTRDQERELLLLKTQGEKAYTEVLQLLDEHRALEDPNVFSHLDQSVVLGIAAKRELRDRNVRFVLDMYLRHYLSYDTPRIQQDRNELVLAGLEGLEIAISKFVTEKYDQSLLAYAQFWIRVKMGQKYREKYDIEVVGTSRIPRKNFTRDTNSAVDELQVTLSRLPTVKEVHDYLVQNFGPKYNTYSQLIRRYLRGELAQNTEDVDFDSLSAESVDFLEEQESDEELVEEFLKLQESFTEREKDYVKVCIEYKIHNQPIPSLTDLARAWNKSKEAIRQIKERVVTKVSEDERFSALKRLFKTNINYFEVNTSEGKKDVSDFEALSSDKIGELQTEIELLIRTNYLPSQQLEDNTVSFIHILSNFIANNPPPFSYDAFIEFYTSAKEVSSQTQYSILKNYVAFSLDILRANYRPEFSQYLNAFVILLAGKKEAKKRNRNDQE